ncbi:MAG: hypothetical protein ACRCX5_14325 [Bacteroidales bacterium]|uniref:hypothetical protein n=1 Tax=Clostridium chrysemydis TaxID=2665504 RepID=UPI003F2FDBE8
MNLNELRLGNYVYGIDPNNKECGMVICKVQCIYMDGAELSGIEVPLCAEYIEPIELTSDILVKCGFKSNYAEDPQLYGNKATVRYYNKRFELYKKALRSTFEFYTYYITVRLEYLHQLQNLYFAINGKELEVKL